MLDEQWLKSLRFETVTGDNVVDLLGIGADWISLEVEDGEGKKFCFQTYRRNLGISIKEIPPGICKNREYDVSRLNRKILRLVGNKLLDDMCLQYDRLYACILRFLYTSEQKGHPELGVPALIMSLPDPDSSYFILSSPGMKRRLADLASLEVKKDKPFTTFGNPFFPNSSLTEWIIKWASLVLKQIENLAVTTQLAKPETFASNPLLVWGAAVMDGFFTEDEMQEAVKYIYDNFGNLVAHSESATWMLQATLFANLHAHFLQGVFGYEPVKRFGQFCGKAGFHFPIYDADGKLITYGF